MEVDLRECFTEAYGQLIGPSNVVLAAKYPVHGYTLITTVTGCMEALYSALPESRILVVSPCIDQFSGEVTAWKCTLKTTGTQQHLIFHLIRNYIHPSHDDVPYTPSTDKPCNNVNLVVLHDLEMMPADLFEYIAFTLTKTESITEPFAGAKVIGNCSDNWDIADSNIVSTAAWIKMNFVNVCI